MPRPNAGESEQDYVSRFMGSAEAQRDFPDEAQRAAVAHSMYRERDNVVETPPVETIPNLCRNVNCLHALDPEHDESGCHVPGCTCMVAERAIEVPEDVIPRENADPNRGGAFDQPNELGCNGCDALRVPLNRAGYCKECMGMPEARNSFDSHSAACASCENAGADIEKLCEEGRRIVSAVPERRNSLPAADQRASHHTVCDSVSMHDAAVTGKELFG